MKLLRLKLNDQFGKLESPFEIIFRKAITGQQTVDWDEFNPFCLAGLNGSGKSNVLEALSNIFYHLESCANVKQPENFKLFFDAFQSSPDGYELEYYITPDTGVSYEIENMVKVCIVKIKGQLPRMNCIPYPFTSAAPANITVLANKTGEFPAEAKKYLPKAIIGYSSGENEILSIPFIKTRLVHFDEYFEALTHDYKYSEPESSLIYIDYEMSQAVLLSNFLMQKPEVVQPLEDHLGIVGIERFRMNLNLHYEGDKELLAQFKGTLHKFKNCATAIFENDDRLILDFWVNDDTKKAFTANFENSAFKLFQSFQILYTLNYRTVPISIKSAVYQSKGYYTGEKIPASAPDENVFYFLDYKIKKKDSESGEIASLLLKNLSDGEQQFLHSLGICLMLKGKSALLFLDEPETHFNPDWRSKFISTIKGSLQAAGANNLMTDLLITSHSPFIMSDCKQDKVLVIRDNLAKNPVINTFGTSVGIITEEIFKKKDTIPDLPIKEIDKIKNMPLTTLEEIQAAKLASRKLGESVEKVLLFRELLIKESTLKNND